MEQSNYLVKEAAERLRSSQTTVRNLIKDKRLRPMNLPTLAIPLREIERFEMEIVESQEDLSRYADKQFEAKYLKDKEEVPVINMVKRKA